MSRDEDSVSDKAVAMVTAALVVAEHQLISWLNDDDNLPRLWQVLCEGSGNRSVVMVRLWMSKPQNVPKVFSAFRALVLSGDEIDVAAVPDDANVCRVTLVRLVTGLKDWIEDAGNARQVVRLIRSLSKLHKEEDLSRWLSSEENQQVAFTQIRLRMGVGQPVPTTGLAGLAARTSL